MGFTGDFFVKHIRPLGDEALAWAMHPDGPVYDYLSNHLGLDDDTIADLFISWTAAAFEEPIPQNAAAFTQAANRLAQARWDEFYPTGRSTLMFLNAAQLQDLSDAGAAHAGQNFTWSPFQPIMIAVTVARNPNVADRIAIDAEGADVAADANGHVVHFAGLNE